MDFLEDDKNKKQHSLFITENIDILDKVKTKEDIDQIISILETHFVFYNLEMEEL